MKIDRRRFLALTTAMAAAHCAPPPAPVVTVPPEDVPIASANAAPTNSSPPPSEAKSAPVATASSSSSSSPTHNGQRDDGSLAMDDNDQTTASAAGVKGQRCPVADNLKGSPGSCASLKAPGPTCESFSDTKSQCDATRSWLKPRVAEKAIACHLAKSGTNNICKFNLVTDCVTESLNSACVDPAAKNICKPIMAKCGTGGGYYASLTQDSCEAAVSAVSDAQKTKFISCITEFCRFQTCFYHLVSTPTAESGKKPLFHR